MEFPEVAIPTYKRHHLISGKTLRFLASVSYPASKVTLFVANEEEALLYYRAVPRALYGKLVVGVPKLQPQRTFISNYYPEDAILIEMDDDIKKIDSPVPFLTLIQNALERINTRKSGLWGVLPNDDKRRYTDDTTIHLTFIIGSFFVFRNHRDLQTTLTQKDDYERSILYFKRYGEVHRYRGAGVSTTYNQGGGGLQEEGRTAKMETEVNQIVQMYPEYCSRKDKKGMPDVALNWRVKN
jgi:hypothetical protein